MKKPDLSTTIGTVCLVLLPLLLLVASQYVWPPPAFQAIWAGALVLSVIALLTGASDDRLNETLKIMFDLALAMVIGLAVFGTQAPSDLSGNLSQAAMLGLVVFAFDSNSRFQRRTQVLADDFSKVATQLKKTETEIRPLLHEAGYAALAARALAIRSSVLGSESLRAEAQESIDAALASTQTWLNVSNGLPMAGSTDAPAASAAWLRAIQVYQREETYDFAKTELATNVRNFAFILLGVIEELAKRKDRQIVALSCSPFPPKDFYNYPAGTKRRRTYREAPFFGTYRRALAQVFANNANVLPMRIFLTRSKKAKKDAAGWPLDRSEDFVCHAANFRFIPVPVSTADNTPIGELLLRHKSPTASASALQATETEPSMFAPLLVDFSGTSASDRAASRAAKIDARQEFCAKAKNEWKDIRAHVKASVDERLKHAQERLSEIIKSLGVQVEARDANGPEPELLAKVAQLTKLFTEALNEQDLTPAVKAAQRLDATMEQLRSSLKSVRHREVLAPAEKVLYEALAASEAKAFFSSALGSEPAPAWLLFLKDMLRIDSSVDELPEVESLRGRVRFLEFAESPKHLPQQVDRGDVLPEFLLLGVARSALAKDREGRPLGANLADVDWHVLVGTRMSEPFATCRVDFRFAGDKELQTHAAWVKELWSDPDADKHTRTMIDDIHKRIRHGRSGSAIP